MKIEDFQKFINEQNTLLRSSYSGKTDREYTLARVVKISEEFGELCDEVLASMGDQRRGKMEKRDKESLAEEFADVVITTFLLAKTMNIDVMEALGRKTEKIKTKHNKQLK